MSTATGILSVRVSAKNIEAADICSFELVEREGRQLPAFAAGSHVDVQLKGGLTRQYSLCNDPSESHRYIIAVLRDVNSRGGSKAMHDEVNVGDVITISSPKNHFQLAHGAERSLLLAGGIGVTPILCMAERLAATEADFEMHYCARSRDRMAFRGRIGASTFASRVRFHLDDEQPQQKLDLDALLAPPPSGTHLYVCGPKGFMDAVLSIARKNSWPEDRLHCEFFAAGVSTSVDGEAFRVRLASSGKVVVVPADKTVVQALAEHGVEVPTSCEQGVCGTCLTRVLEGEPDHRDLFLTPQEHAVNDQFTPCCSRAKSAMLVLDL